MIKTTLLVSVILFFIFINFSFAASITPFKWDKPVDPGELMEACPLEQQDESEPKATITNIEGIFQILRADGAGEWKEHFYDPKKEIKDKSVIELKSGDRIRTGGSSNATLNFSDGSSVVLGIDTSITYRETETITKIELLLGKLRVMLSSNLLEPLKKKIRAKLETKMRVSAVCVRGTDFIMEQTEDINTSRYYLHEGTLDVVNLNGETMQLNSGDVVTINRDGEMVLEKLEQEKWDQLISEIGLTETSNQINQYGAVEKETNAWSLDKWLGLIVVLFGIAGVGFFIYRIYRKKY